MNTQDDMSIAHLEYQFLFLKNQPYLGCYRNKPISKSYFLAELLKTQYTKQKQTKKSLGELLKKNFYL